MPFGFVEFDKAVGFTKLAEFLTTPENTEAYTDQDASEQVKKTRLAAKAKYAEYRGDKGSLTQGEGQFAYYFNPIDGVFKDYLPEGETYETTDEGEGEGEVSHKKPVQPAFVWHIIYASGVLMAVMIMGWLSKRSMTQKKIEKDIVVGKGDSAVPVPMKNLPAAAQQQKNMDYEKYKMLAGMVGSMDSKPAKIEFHIQAAGAPGAQQQSLQNMMALGLNPPGKSASAYGAASKPPQSKPSQSKPPHNPAPTLRRSQSAPAPATAPAPAQAQALAATAQAPGPRIANRKAAAQKQKTKGSGGRGRRRLGQGKVGRGQGQPKLARSSKK